MAEKRKGAEVFDADKDYLEIMPLGSGNEVGRSCHIVRFKGKTIMLDCGIHPAYDGMLGLPFFDEIEASEIDILLISHFHLDHAAALPYFLKETDFKGRVFMTHPTKSIYKLILQDYVKVSSISADDALYDEQDLLKSMDRIEAINYHEVVHHKGIKFWCYNAGHVLGAAMFMIEIAGIKLLYTGDYSRREDRHLMSAETPSVKPDILIVESTYGVQTLQPVLHREKRFTEFVHQIVKRRGRCLIPVFALGRAQELLLILDEYWEANPQLQSIPIYYASSLAKKCMTVYQTYVNMMNKHIQRQSQVSNPFVFKHVMNLRGMEQFDDSGPCVVMASPGMLQNGLSRELFELWCSDKRNGCVIPGYCVDGTLAKHILSEPTHITTVSGLKVRLNMSVHYVSFSAHADYAETSGFVGELLPPHVILVHGDGNEMARLKYNLQRKFAETTSMQISTPKNCQTVELEFRAQKIAKTVGSLASQGRLSDGGLLSGLIVRKDFNYHIMAANDLSTYTPLASTTVNQKMTVPFGQSFECLRAFVAEMYNLDENQASDSEEEKLVIEVVEEPAADVKQNGGKKSTGKQAEVDLKKPTDTAQEGTVEESTIKEEKAEAEKVEPSIQKVEGDEVKKSDMGSANEKTVGIDEKRALAARAVQEEDSTLVVAGALQDSFMVRTKKRKTTCSERMFQMCTTVAKLIQSCLSGEHQRSIHMSSKIMVVFNNF